MALWDFEPGHTAAEFCVRHMMVTLVRGHFKDVHGTLDFDESDPGRGTTEVTIDATGLWTGEPTRDAHLKSQDFSRCTGTTRCRKASTSWGTTWRSRSTPRRSCTIPQLDARSRSCR